MIKMKKLFKTRANIISIKKNKKGFGMLKNKRRFTKKYELDSEL